MVNRPFNVADEVTTGGAIVFSPPPPGTRYALESIPENTRVRKPPFIGIRTGDTPMNKEKSLLQVIGKMTTAERWFFLYLEARMNPTNNVAIINNKELTKTQLKYKGIAYKTLAQKDLVRRLRREHYMINPGMIISFKDAIYTESVKIWETLA